MMGCPLCRSQSGDVETLAHKRTHIPEATTRRYAESFPHVSEQLRESMAFLHVLTNQHQSGRCCR